MASLSVNLRWKMNIFLFSSILVRARIPLFPFPRFSIKRHTTRTEREREREKSIFQQTFVFSFRTQNLFAEWLWVAKRDLKFSLFWNIFRFCGTTKSRKKTIRDISQLKALLICYFTARRDKEHFNEWFRTLASFFCRPFIELMKSLLNAWIKIRSVIRSRPEPFLTCAAQRRRSRRKLKWLICYS